MPEQEEWDRIEEEVMRLCGCMARVRKLPMPEKMFKREAECEFSPEGRIYAERCALQVGQLLEFKRFISIVADSYLQLLEEPEQAEKIGREGLEKLHAFLKDYTRLLAEELSWC